MAGRLVFGVQKADERGQCLMYESEGYLKDEYTKNTGLLGSRMLLLYYGFRNRHKFGQKEISSCFKSLMYSFLGCSKNMYRLFS